MELIKEGLHGLATARKEGVRATLLGLFFLSRASFQGRSVELTEQSTGDA
jgi:hypothetical protein